MEQLADYRLVRELGSGPQGRVHVAVSPPRLGLDGAEVALKVFAAFVEDSGFERAAGQLTVHAGTGSDRLIRVLDLGLQESTMFLALELATGPVDAGDAELAIRAVVRAAEAAHSLHEAGVVHGAIKPPNLLVTARGVVLSEPNLADVVAPGQTATGVGPKGGLQYLDPTLLAGASAGRASDIWALGVTLHELLTGHGVHPDLDPTNTMAALRTLVEQDPVIDPSLPAEVRPVVEACLAPERSARPGTAAEVAARLSAIAGGG